MLKLLNKFAIPTILLATVMVAGMFAFMPVEQASTVHESVSSSISGAPTVKTLSVTSENLNSQDPDNGDAFHHFVLTSEVPFTIHDIEVTGTISGGTESVDLIEIRPEAYPAEYGLDAITADDEGRTEILFSDLTVVDGNDDFATQTMSAHVRLADNFLNDMRFTENTNVVVQITFNEDNNGDGGVDTDFTAVVTFYLSGASEAQVTLTLDDNVDSGDTI